MTARKSNKADEDQKVDTAGENNSQTTQTTDNQDSAPSTVSNAGETDAKGAASGEVAGGVEYGDSGFDDDAFSDGGDLAGSVGTVREGDNDVPYFYLTANDVKEGAKVRTADSDDDDVVKWNVQTTSDDGETPVGLVPKEQTPGQTFVPAELPNLEVMEKAGIDVAQFLSGLPVRLPVEGEPHRRGIPA